ncbi:MAG: histidinol dehydrogenase [Thermoproteota archaeon]|nr:histidinol dehydrogenase [Thermoproteota archaeon]
MIKILQVGNVDSFVESRRQKTSQKDRKIVQSILDDVRKNGDSAVKKYEQKFNGKKTTQLRVNKQEVKNAKITDAEFSALQLSAIRLSKSQKMLNKSLIQSVKKIT